MISAGRSDLLPVGETAPDFTGQASDGTIVSLSELNRKKRVVFVFYPGDNTPVCTAQLCSFRDDWSSFQSEDTLVYGVNPASREKHHRFAEKYQFPFPLIADQSAHIAAAYGCRSLFGLIRRTVYLIDRRGQIAYAKRGNPAPEELLEVLRRLQDSPTP